MLLLPLLKKCSACKFNKPYIAFCKDKLSKDGFSYNCKLCHNEVSKRSYLKNIDKKKQYCRQYHKDNAEKINLRSKQHRLDNVEHYKKYRKVYFITEKGKLARKSYKHKRRSLINDNTPIGKHWTTEDIKLKLKLQHGKCIYCETLIKNGYHIDHFIPLTKGGSNEANNIQLLCKDCNGSGGKGSKLPIEYAQKHGKLF